MKNITLIALALIFGFGTITGCQGQTEPKEDKKSSLIDKAKDWFGEDEPAAVESTDEVQTDAPVVPVEKVPDESLKVKASSMLNTFQCPNLGFWVGCVVAFILISLYAEYDGYEEYQGVKQGGNVLAGFLVCGLIYLNRGVFLELWESYSWIGLATVVGIFVVSGILNFWIKWELKTSNALDRIKAHEQKFLREEKIKDADGRIYTEIPDDKEIIKNRNGYFGLHGWTLELPIKAQNKALLTKWACTGPISLPGTLVINGAQVFGNVVYKWFGFIADRITRRHEKQILR